MYGSAHLVLQDAFVVDEAREREREEEGTDCESRKNPFHLRSGAKKRVKERGEGTKKKEKGRREKKGRLHI
jgi:hypothetical protein